jgi:LPS sulfotransferase NodH
MFAELFNQLEKERRRAFKASFEDCEIGAAPHPSVTLDENECYSDEQDGEEFLKRAVFYKHASDGIAVGFKIFFHQARSNANARKVWQYLICNKDIRIIHLKRHNLIESMISLRLALQTDQWIFQHRKADQALSPMYMSPRQCENYFRHVLAGRHWARRHFRHHQSLEIEYEADLFDSFQDTIHRVQDFLEVPRRPARKLLKKQAQRKPSEQIGNYEELKAHFAHTPYACWFE